MDDIIAKDIDQRILTLLEQKAADLGEGIMMVVTDQNGTLVIAPESYLHMPIKAFQNSYLAFQSPIYSSFDKTKNIGTLWLLYPYRNLRHLHTGNPAKKLWLQPTAHTLYLPLPDTSDAITVSRAMPKILAGWTLHLSYQKAQALATLHAIEKIQFYTFVFSTLLLALLLWLLSKSVTLPLIRLLRESQKALDAKSTFLSTISHELRTPLGSILNLTQHLTLSPKADSKMREMLSGIETSATHLLAMIDNILQLSKLESKDIVVHRERIDLEETIREVVEITHPLMLEKEILFRQNIAIDTKEITTDGNMLKQVIINLLSNAIKFTDEHGEISLDLTNERNSYSLTIRDSGIGIEKARLQHLFTPFMQAHADLKNLKNSSGLGLALSQKVAHLLGGKITIESEGRGKGVTAIFNFKSFQP